VENVLKLQMLPAGGLDVVCGSAVSCESGISCGSHESCASWISEATNVKV